MTDAKLGMLHWRQGLEARYPHNPRYMAAFRAGKAWLLRGADKDRPDDDMSPGGTNDTHFDVRHGW